MELGIESVSASYHMASFGNSKSRPSYRNRLARAPGTLDLSERQWIHEGRSQRRECRCFGCAEEEFPRAVVAWDGGWEDRGLGDGGEACHVNGVYKLGLRLRWLNVDEIGWAGSQLDMDLDLDEVNRVALSVYVLLDVIEIVDLIILVE